MFVKQFQKHLSSSLCPLIYLFSIFPDQYEVISISQREAGDNSLLLYKFQNRFRYFRSVKSDLQFSQ